MFNEDEDWNDAQDVQVLEKSGPENTPKAKSSSNVKSKVVGKKSLLRTLQTLGSVPDWESNSRQQDSDSEAEAAPAHKKRKKRRKRRKQAEKSEEQEENVDGVVKEDAAGPKKKKKGNKFGVPNSNGVDAGKKKNEENPASEQVDAKIPANTDKISRQQWKNKMKNKRKSKNKYRQSKAVEDVDKEKDDKQESKAEVKPESQSKNTSESISLRAPQKKKMERQCKPPKRKHPEEDPPVPEARQQKAEKLQKSVKAEKRVHEPPAERSEQKAAQLQQELPDNQPHLPPKRFELSREQSLKRQKMQRMLLRREESPPEPPPGGAEPEPAPAGGEEESPPAAPSRSDALRSRMEQRLEAARFRYINELLYSTSSGEARRMFQQDPNAFWVYHKGYTAQVQRWPANPVDAIISFIRQKPSSLVVADFGCGDCKIARSVKNRVHSFDLASTCELVTVCDMASVPLGDGSVDIAVFCLSLMGTNLADFLTEANRVLKTGGVLKIAEVASRFDNDRNFVSSLANLGFKLVSKDTENSHFYSFDFVKTGNAPKNVKKYGLQLKPCLYKKR